MSIVKETKVHTNMKMVNASMQMEQDILFMKPIKKIKFNQNLEVDRTGHKIGKIRLNRLSEKLSTDELKMYFIDFEKGSKSKLHLHDSDQIIVAVKGKGQLVTYSGIDTVDGIKANLRIVKSIEMKEGDTVLIPSGTLHWHGASEDQSSSQISLMKNGNTY